MEVYYEDTKFQQKVESDRERRREWGDAGAKKIATRLRDLRQTAETLEDMRHLPGHCHELTGDWSGHLSLRLDGGYRLIIRPREWAMNDSGGLNWSAVTAVVIVTIEDYH
ncbi:type II toxin-antitoxin system RelE/ParE family toxin [Microbispora bryophytorum]|uniref:type II toxin-antitoxin system RelE/ParE family toxin n=1 Tax=Microbispora bryophytorum TaxID=1460882 RepID=UPI0033EBB871